MYIYVYFVFLLKIDEMWCCWWIVDEFMINYCCCYVMLLLMIDAMGNHKHRACYEFVFFLRIFMKNGSNGDFCWNNVLVQVLYGFESLFMFINVWTNFGDKFKLKGFKIGILGWKWSFSRELSIMARHGE